MRDKDFKNILIIGHSNIGDVCNDLTVVTALHRAYPAAKITFLTSWRGQELVLGYPGIEKIVIYDRDVGNRILKGRLELIRALRKEKFDLALVLKRSLFFLFLGIPKVLAFKQRFFKDATAKEIHRIDAYLNILRSADVRLEGGVEFNFDIGAGERKFLDSFFKKQGLLESDTIVAILPFTNWSLKCWPIDSWNELIEILVNTYGLKVVILGKEADDAYNREVVERISKLAISAINKCSLKQSMAIIKKSKLFISSESSLLHIASCMHVPCIGLYGPTSKSRYYPYFHRQNAIAREPALKCMPCVVRGNCKAQGGQAPCMVSISVKEVLDKALDLLNIKPKVR